MKELPSDPLVGALSNMLASKSEQLVGLPELRDVTFKPASRSAQALLQAFKILLVLFVLAGIGMFAKGKYAEYRHEQTVATHQQALVAFEAEDHAKAEELWQEALLGFRATRDNPAQLETYLWLAKNANQAGEHKDALAFLHRATEQPELGDITELKDMMDDIYLDQGGAALEDGMVKLEAELWQEASDAGVEALASFNNSSADDSEMAAVHRLLGFSQLELGQKLSAIDHLRSSLEFEKDEELAELLKVLQPDPKYMTEWKMSDAAKQARAEQKERRRYRRGRYRRSRRYSSYTYRNSSYYNRHRSSTRSRRTSSSSRPRTNNRYKPSKRPVRVNATVRSQADYPTVSERRKRMSRRERERERARERRRERYRARNNRSRSSSTRSRSSSNRSRSSNSRYRLPKPSRNVSKVKVPSFPG